MPLCPLSLSFWIATLGLFWLFPTCHDDLWLYQVTFLFRVVSRLLKTAVEIIAIFGLLAVLGWTCTLSFVWCGCLCLFKSLASAISSHKSHAISILLNDQFWQESVHDGDDGISSLPSSFMKLTVTMDFRRCRHYPTFVHHMGEACYLVLPKLSANARGDIFRQLHAWSALVGIGVFCNEECF